MQYEDDEETSLPFHNITPEQAQALIEQGAQIIDVRQPGEWMRGHIPQAELIPLDGIYLFGKALEESQPKDKEIILTCEMGQRSVMAAEIALVAGYTKVYNLVGGMSAWRARRLPTER